MGKYYKGMTPEAALDRLRRACKQAKDVEAEIDRRRELICSELRELSDAYRAAGRYAESTLLEDAIGIVSLGLIRRIRLVREQREADIEALIEIAEEGLKNGS